MQAISYAARVAKWVLPGGQKVDIPRTLWFPSAMTVVSLFLAGLYLGTVVGRAPDAGAAFITTLTVKGKVVKLHGKPIKVLVPATTIVKNGRVVTLRPRTINLTQRVNQTAATVTDTRRVVSTVSQTVVVPTTMTATEVLPTTYTETVTVTDTVTSTTTDTGTTTVSSSVAVP
jgi:hypothetical protein